MSTLLPSELLSEHSENLQALWAELQACRQKTLTVLATIAPDLSNRQAHPDFSPIGWHIGHIAYTESLWILQKRAGQPPLEPAYEILFAADGLPKADRVHLPDLATLYAYLTQVRTEVEQYWRKVVARPDQPAAIAQLARLGRFLLQHESQHVETITVVHQLLCLSPSSRVSPSPVTPTPPSRDHRASPLANRWGEMVEIPGGPFQMGSAAAMALDNERECHTVTLPTYWIDRYPVTWGQYAQFIDAGGYRDRRWWSAAGWQWLQQTGVREPLYRCFAGDTTRTAEADRFAHPVCGVSWYEADAYARFVGKRLPTEAEWEKAASGTPLVAGSRQAMAPSSYPYPWGDASLTANHCNYGHQVGGTTPVNAYPAGQSAYGCYDLLGNVWEWTASWFAPYPGFQPYPYQGYSQPYFDQAHRVMRGGSWATYPWGLRNQFRNWYHPHMRQLFVGFRCACDGPPASAR
ncbi:SUMF1/EgtB/PvdO family nonheme iron enzyme [Trichothermofontia sp.]